MSQSQKPLGFSDEEWEAISSGVPKGDEPFLQQYLRGREALIVQENTQRSDASFRQSLSPIARRACAIAERIRDEEKKTIWTPQFEESLAHEQTENITVYPGMMFSLAKERAVSTKLWRIVRRMPKGSLLHSHFDAMVDVDFIIGVLLDTPGMHMLADRPLDSPAALEEAKLTFRFFKASRTDGNVWDSAYKPGTPILLTQTADSFPELGREGFPKWLCDRLTISRTEAVEQHHGVDHIWKLFSSRYHILESIIRYEPIYRRFLRRLLSILKDDGINYSEIRFSWAFDYYRQDREVPEGDYSAMLNVLDEEVKRFQSSEEGRGFWGIRMIWASLRFKNTREIIQDMDNCITTKLTHPHLIAGYDVVAQEDLGRPHRDLLPEIMWFRKQCAEEGVNIPFFFHAGECLGTGSETDHNLFDAILLGTRRIGHGFSLYKHPLLVDLVKQKRILVESCPISNEVLRLCSSVMSHPLPALLARGVPCALGNDDPGILGQGKWGTTHDFWQALQGWDNLGLAGLGSLAENSVRWSAFEDQSTEDWERDISQASLGTGLKAKYMKEWAVEWERFCIWIVDEFGDEFPEEDGEEEVDGSEGRIKAEQSQSQV
ncbi:adenosine deaminase-related growth factor [Xylaria sp. CBS 124048]|nr:adenosine deaminase-related growth factor [Xylaria sp. CBS 124048]